MNSEEAQALIAENEALRAEADALRQRLAELARQLQAVLAQTAELERRGKNPPAFVKPNRPARK